LLEQIRQLSIGPNASLREAMEAIQRGACGIALVVDEEGRLLGVMTDGDIRRAVLGGAALGDPVEPYMVRNYTAAGPAAGRSEVLDLMRARSLSQIPIVDEAGKLLGIHLLREIIGAAPRPNWAVVMAGGRGERLRPLTDAIPKPMVRVAGRPILERIVLHLVGFGIRRVFISVNYLGKVIEEHFEHGARFGCRIEYLREDRPLGTGGSLSLLPGLPEHPLLVLNGDLITQLNVHDMLAFHAAGSFALTVGVHQYAHTVPYGVLDVAGGCVQAITEKPTARWLINAGAYVLSPCVLDRLPKQEPFTLPALVETCLGMGDRVGAFPIEEEWIDVGQHQELQRARGDRPAS
jgi:dTDP-glucose pyrophosphorylase